MVRIPFVARCARCGNASFTLPDSLVLEADIACGACGHEGKLVEFADLTTLDAILEMQGGKPGLLH